MSDVESPTAAKAKLKEVRAVPRVPVSQNAGFPPFRVSCPVLRILVPTLTRARFFRPYSTPFRAPLSPPFRVPLPRPSAPPFPTLWRLPFPRARMSPPGASPPHMPSVLRSYQTPSLPVVLSLPLPAPLLPSPHSLHPSFLPDSPFLRSLPSSPISPSPPLFPVLFPSSSRTNLTSSPPLPTPPRSFLPITCITGSTVEILKDPKFEILKVDLKQLNFGTSGNLLFDFNNFKVKANGKADVKALVVNPNNHEVIVEALNVNLKLFNVDIANTSIPGFELSKKGNITLSIPFPIKNLPVIATGNKDNLITTSLRKGQVDVKVGY
ncbi:unnamed protein product [Closterium sp. NIES-65]|nr:unnamed protein product [Closterium sp. NIES-65]